MAVNKLDGDAAPADTSRRVEMDHATGIRLRYISLKGCKYIDRGPESFQAAIGLNGKILAQHDTY